MGFLPLRLGGIFTASERGEEERRRRSWTTRARKRARGLDDARARARSPPRRSVLSPSLPVSYAFQSDIFTSTYCVRARKKNRSRPTNAAVRPQSSSSSSSLDARAGAASSTMPPRPPMTQPAARQTYVLVGVAIGLALAGAPLAFRSVRQREQEVRRRRDWFPYDRVRVVNAVP